MLLNFCKRITLCSIFLLETLVCMCVCDCDSSCCYLWLQFLPFAALGKDTQFIYPFHLLMGIWVVSTFLDFCQPPLLCAFLQDVHGEQTDKVTSGHSPRQCIFYSCPGSECLLLCPHPHQF